jgi:sugar O-acyltransferase (sialic acid O-acetyltransferase NeuD family)
MKHMYIVGAGALGRELLSLLHKDSAHGREWVVVGFVDSRAELKGQIIGGIPVVGGVEDAPVHEMAIYCSAIGDPVVKKEIVTALEVKGAVFVPIRTQCEVGQRAHIGAAVLQLNATVSVDAFVDDHVYLDSGSVIGHDARVGRYSHIGRNVFVGGRVEIGEGVVAHSCSIISQGVKINAGATIGIGAVVLRDVPASAVMIGNPAKNVKN